MEKSRWAIALVTIGIISLSIFDNHDALAGTPRLPQVSISDVTMTEGDFGTTNFVFTVTVGSSPDPSVTVHYSTSDGTGRDADNDYNEKSDDIQIATDSSATITITVNGDNDLEDDETFFVDLSNCMTFNGRDCNFIDSQGQGTILNDDNGEPEPSETAYVSGSTSSSENLQAGAIGIVDFVSGQITQIGNQIVELGGLSGLTFVSNGDLFGTSIFTEFSSPSELYKIDPITGDETLINDIAIFSEFTFPLKIRDLATQPGTDVIFGVGNVMNEGGFEIGCPDYNSLFTINKEFASAQCIGTLAIEGVIDAQFGGLAFAPDGTLWATGSGCVDNGESCEPVNFLASFNADASSAGSFLGIQNSLHGLGIRESDGAFFGTTGVITSVHSIDLVTGETPLVAGEGDSPSDITFFPFEPEQTAAGGKMGIYQSPTLGELYDGRLILSDGFCFDKFCMDVTDYFNHLPIRQVNSGSAHTISLTAYCAAGSNRCNYASVGAAPPGTDINSIKWNVILQRTGNTNDWQVTKNDPDGMLGDITGTVQMVDASRIQYTFNIRFIAPASIGTSDGNAEPPEDNLILVTEIRDSNGGVGRNIFNEGVFVNDIYAYPQVEASYASPVKVAPLCLNEDATDRNTCAFEQVRQWTIKQAEEKLKEINERHHTKKD